MKSLREPCPRCGGSGLLNRSHPCPACGGTGAAWPEAPERCPDCGRDLRYERHASRCPQHPANPAYGHPELMR